MEEQKEEWRPIVGYERMYEVSNLSRIRNKRTGFILKPVKPPTTKHYVVSLGDRTCRRTIGIARIVAMSFLGMPDDPAMHIWCKDGNQENMLPGNLVWAKINPELISKEARAEASKRIRRPEIREAIARSLKKYYEEPEERAKLCLRRAKASMITQKKVICMETGVVYPNVEQTAKAFSIPASAVYASCQDRYTSHTCLRNKAGNPVFHFRYYNPEDWKPKERIWRPVRGFEGKYEVSNLGEVKYVKTGSLRSAYRPSHSRTLMVNLMTGHGKVVYMTVAKMVAEAFLPKVYGAPEVGHKDGDLDNNCVTNLYWSSNNSQLANPVSRYNYMQTRPKRAVFCVETGAVFASIKEAAEFYNMNETTVGMSCRRESKGQKYRLKQVSAKPILHFRYAD